MGEARVFRFEAPDAGTLDRIVADPAPGGIPCGPPGLDLFREVYWDTPAGELERRGVRVCLRIRADGGSTLRVEVRDPAGEAAPRRASADLPGDDPHEAFAGDTEPARLLRAATDPARLVPRLELETTRRVRRLEPDGAAAGATLACDATTARAGGEAADLYTVELRVPPGTADELAGTARGLAAAYGLRPTAEERPERAVVALAGDGARPARGGRPGPAEVNGSTSLHPGTGRGGMPEVHPASLLEAGDRTDPGDELPPGSLLNMELSTLAFNRRVLVLAEDPRTPLFERVRFVSIFGANLDEFFRVRVAGFKHQVAAGSRKRTMDGAAPAEQLEAMRTRARDLARRADDLLRDVLIPELEQHGIRVVPADALTPEDRVFLRGWYRQEVHPRLTPLAAGPGHPFPHIRNLRPALAVLVRDPHDGENHLSIVPLPGDLPRLVPLPGGGDRLHPLEEVVRAHLRELYPGAEVVYACLFRVTRSAELHVPKDHAVEDLLAAVEEELAKRPFRPVVRLEVEEGMSPEVRRLLLRELRDDARDDAVGLDDADVHPVDGLIDLRALREIAGLPRPELRYPPFRGSDPLRDAPSVMEALRDDEVLVHFPYHSFEGTVERFLLEAAEDPDVLSIRLALYRTNRSSRIVEALRRASERGKDVVALVELTARFDEQRNVEWAHYLRASGIRVVYGVPGQKIHAKVALVVRREGGETRRYAYIGTGNLNAATAGAYTDLGLLTRDPALGADAAHLFGLLTGEEEDAGFRELLVAPFNMRARFLELIAREAEHARYGREGHIRVKINGLADREMIAALYRASRAGVRIELIVRGICALRPGVPGYSENIRVVSILGRFLEHARIFRFANGGRPEYFIGSADWRTRNLATRVEVVTPVTEPAHRDALDGILEEQLADPDAWELGSDGSYYRRPETPPRAEATDPYTGA
jgi:polyphosphate kinase